MSASGAVETVRRGVAAAGAALFGVFALAAPAAAHASVQAAAADVYTMSAGLGATTAAVLALIGVIVAGRHPHAFLSRRARANHPFGTA
ncbi:hypothetical protein GPZ77_32260 [Streptomyces sp. QHH-9511]|uniref:hypothetical protein n=1 Tax=Streptomyces sp. QHH-9511 TaxID=2684468 RepID=UPI001316A26C|nr:hypothetical protein [Streptomyces sp. QHH-9511]QGZ52387.1 hypothetical protein GPZ77_32260 [Streptomyces sp. QHH-9511]